MDIMQGFAVLAQATAKSARVVKLVDAGDSKSPAARRAGSIPAPGTTVKSSTYAISQARKTKVFRVCSGTCSGFTEQA